MQKDKTEGLNWGMTEELHRQKRGRQFRRHCLHSVGNFTEMPFWRQKTQPFTGQFRGLALLKVGSFKDKMAEYFLQPLMVCQISIAEKDHDILKRTLLPEWV